jgi:hypothetical protein
MKKFLLFETFISPWFVKLYWYVITAGCVVMGLGRIIQSFNEYGSSPFSTTMQKPSFNLLFQGIGILIVLPLMLRVLCEVILSIVKKPVKE